jgi:hypothetical protein
MGMGETYLLNSWSKGAGLGRLFVSHCNGILIVLGCL